MPTIQQLIRKGEKFLKVKVSLVLWIRVLKEEVSVLESILQHQKNLTQQ